MMKTRIQLSNLVARALLPLVALALAAPACSGDLEAPATAALGGEGEDEGDDDGTLEPAARCSASARAACDEFDPQGPFVLHTDDYENELLSVKLNPSRDGVPVAVLKNEEKGVKLADGGSMAGVELLGGIKELKILAMGPDDALGRPTYKVAIIKANNGLVPLCKDYAPAYLIPGQFHPDGRFKRLPDMVSFSCPGGAAAKALMWGYSPWDNVPYYQAAFRMARADYCGNGKPHTLLGTTIGFRDLYGYNKKAIHSVPEAALSVSGTFRFEAAWSLDPNKGALCLSRWRWNALAPVDECPLQLPDPRAHKTKGKPCEDLVLADGEPPPATQDELFERLEKQGAGTFSFVSENDAGVWNWMDASGKHVLASRDGFYGGASMATSAPDDEHPYPRDFVGAVFAEQDADGRRVQLSVYRWMDDDGPGINDFYWATTNDTAIELAGWEHVSKLGYLYKNQPGDVALPTQRWSRLQSWHQPGTPRRILLPPGRSAPFGFVFLRHEGYVLE